MKIGLIRHFKVVADESTFLYPNEFAQAMEKYDIAPVQRNGLEIDSSDWDICYSSTLPRAVTTAESIFRGKIIKTDLLIEVPISPFTKKNIKLPSFLWHIGSRLAWYKSHKSQQENIRGTKARIRKFYEMIRNSEQDRILIVSHGYFLRMFYDEMKKIGFEGKVDLNVQNGKLYIIQKNQ